MLYVKTLYLVLQIILDILIGAIIGCAIVLLGSIALILAFMAAVVVLIVFTALFIIGYPYSSGKVMWQALHGKQVIPHMEYPGR
jgi:hypothetical protein